METNFKENGFAVLKGVLPEKVANFAYKYLLLKRKIAYLFYKNKYVPPESGEWGTWSDKQVPNTYSVYGDISMEIILEEIKPLMEKVTERKLFETYSYARIYKKGDVLARHKDRFSCEISTTMNLGGDDWPIYLSPYENVGIPNESTGITSQSKAQGIKVILNPGDMLIYKGNVLEHWREEFTGEDCGQVFLHYNDASTPGAEQNKYDGRLCLGLPAGVKFKI